MISAISSIGQAISLTQRLREISKSIENAEFTNLLADLSMELADTKMALVDMKEENTKLKSQILDLKNKDDNQPIYEKPYYYLYDIKGNKDGPYCQKCYDSDKKLLRLQSPRSKGFWLCNECKSDYTDSDYKPLTGPITVKSHRLSDF